MRRLRLVTVLVDEYDPVSRAPNRTVAWSSSSTWRAIDGT
jgi:hypothetical protein